MRSKSIQVFSSYFEADITLFLERGLRLTVIANISDVSGQNNTELTRTKYGESARSWAYISQTVTDIKTTVIKMSSTCSFK
jgi:hypothetical protein